MRSHISALSFAALLTAAPQALAQSAMPGQVTVPSTMPTQTIVPSNEPAGNTPPPLTGAAEGSAITNPNGTSTSTGAVTPAGTTGAVTPANPICRPSVTSQRCTPVPNPSCIPGASSASTTPCPAPRVP